MMDDVSPPSLPTNDCAASKARRIEGRPARALRPSSERLGRITLKRGALAIDSKVDSSSEDLFRNLSDDNLGEILARLSLFSLMAAKKVCKRWASVTSTRDFDILRKELNHKPVLVRYGIRTLQSVAYDVENNAWVILPGLQLPAQFPFRNFGSYTGASGVVFFVAGPGKDRLCYKLTSSASSAESFGETWYETPVMTFPRLYPVVSVALGAGRGHRLVVAGGGSDVTPSHSAVEVFDSEIGTWESYGDLPEEFEYVNSEVWMSGVVCDNKFYVSLLCKSTGEQARIHSLDLYTKQWTSIQVECTKVLRSSRFLAIGSTLVIAGVYSTADNGPECSTVTLWKVDLKTLRLIQIWSMPSELRALVGGRQFLTFLSDENLVYFSLNGEIVLAEVSLEECRTSCLLLPKVQGVDLSVNFLASITSA